MRFLLTSFFFAFQRSEFVATFIDFPKPLIAAVNGPAVGVSVTVLALCDLVYAADHVRLPLAASLKSLEL